MKTAPMSKKLRETLISGILSLLLMTGLLALLIIAGYLFAANTDERIAAAAKQAFVSQAYLKGDDIQVRSQDGAVTLVIHELLHPLLDEQLEEFLNAEVAEFAIRGIEEGLLKALSKNPREYEKWRNAIARKVEGV